MFGGRHLLAEAGNLGLLRQLAGVSGCKPWDCVGTPAETRQALDMAVQLHQTR